MSWKPQYNSLRTIRCGDSSTTAETTAVTSAREIGNKVGGILTASQSCLTPVVLHKDPQTQHTVEHGVW